MVIEVLKFFYYTSSDGCILATAFFASGKIKMVVIATARIKTRSAKRALMVAL